MSPSLVVETSDLAAASHALSDRVGERLWTRVGAALDDAASCTGMAGDDAAGLQWAAAYEQSAVAAAQAAQDVTNGAFTLSALLAATAQNYARADAASTIGGQHAVDDVISNLPDPTTVTLATRFDGSGGGPPDAPFGWSHVEHYVRLTWPNGHQDRLRTAGAAWRRSAGVLSEAAEDVDLALLEPLMDGLPEWRDIRTACWSLSGHLRRVAGAHRSLADACDRFAHHLDVAHAELLHEIRVFLIESGAIEVGGNILSALTWGVLELPTQSVEASRIAATVAAIVKDVTELGIAVREIVMTLPVVQQVSVTVSAALRDLLGVRVVWAEVAGVPGLRVLSIARDGRNLSDTVDATGELGAVSRLSNDATLPTELRTALDAPRSGEWNDGATLGDHVDRHAAKLGLDTSEEYVSGAREFFRRGLRDHLSIKVDEQRNTIRVFDSETKTFGSYTLDGAVRTYFRGTSKTFWAKQPGTEVKW